MQTQLRSAYRRGKYIAAQAAFPAMTWGQVYWAVYRFVFDFENDSSPQKNVLSAAEARERLAALDDDLFLEGIARLLRTSSGTAIAAKALGSQMVHAEHAER